jgi:hypothetical protein
MWLVRGKHSFSDYDMTKLRFAQRQHPFFNIKSVVTSLRLPSPNHYALSPESVGCPYGLLLRFSI